MTEPLVSILIPTHNGARFLKHTLRSALTQTYRNIEVVVGDDVSDDATPELLAAAAAADDRIVVVRHPTNLGSWRNPRALLERARGEYVKFLFHDDLLLPTCVRTLTRGLADNPQAMLAFSRRSLTDENGSAVPGHSFPALADRAGLLDGHELADACLTQTVNLIGELTTVLFRRADLDPSALDQRVDGHLLPVVGDVSIWLQLLGRGPAFYSPEVLSRFRLHGGQNTHRPSIHARGPLDWALLLDWAHRAGFVQDPGAQLQAWRAVLRLSVLRAEEVDTTLAGASLEAVHLATCRLTELAARVPVDTTIPLVRRAHSPAGLLQRGQMLGAWTTDATVAVAVPGPGELRATTAAFQVAAGQSALDRLVVVVPPGRAADAHHELDALSLPEDVSVAIAVEESPTPTRSVPQPWVALAPVGAAWPDERAAALWTYGSDGEVVDAPSSVLS